MSILKFRAWVAEDVRGCITGTGDLRQVRRGDLSSTQLFPVDLAKPRMCKHVSRTVLEVTVPLCWVVLEELENEVCRVSVECGPADGGRARTDLFVQLDVRDIRLVEGRQTRQHLEYQDTQRVPVDRLVVSLVTDDLGAGSVKRGCQSADRTHLWGQVIGCAAEGPRNGTTVLCETEVSDFDMSIVIQEYVLRLKVAVYDVGLVQVVERERDLGGVELRDWVWEPLCGGEGEFTGADQNSH